MWTFEIIAMNTCQRLHKLGQSLWLDGITCNLLNQGTLQGYIDDLSVTGLTSNLAGFDHAIKNCDAYDNAILEGFARGKSGEEIFLELAIEDLTRAADLFHFTFNQTSGVDGWASLEASPRHAYDTDAMLEAAMELHARADCPNLFIKIPGTKEGLLAIEEATYAGVPVNATLLFSHEQYIAAAEAYLRGIERRIENDFNPNVASVASVCVSPWDSAIAGKVSTELNNQLGVAMANRIYKTYREFLNTPRWQRAFNAGARPQRLLWSSTGTKDLSASDILYVKALAAPFTVSTMCESTIKAVADQGKPGPIIPADGGNCEKIIEKFTKAGIRVDALAGQLQTEGVKSLVKSWNELMAGIDSKGAVLMRDVCQSIQA